MLVNSLATPDAPFSPAVNGTHEIKQSDVSIFPSEPILPAERAGISIYLTREPYKNLSTYYSSCLQQSEQFKLNQGKGVRATSASFLTSDSGRGAETGTASVTASAAKGGWIEAAGEIGAWTMAAGSSIGAL